jgi:hypothetical protein
MKPTAISGTLQRTEAENVIWLSARAAETLEVTELTPAKGEFIGKTILSNNRIQEYPKVMWWHQAVSQVPATIPALFAYLREARTRNVCLIPGTPARELGPGEQTRRQRANEQGRGDHGFLDLPTRLFFFDVDGAKITWREDPEIAVRTLVTWLGEPWASSSFAWFISGTCGLETVQEIDDADEDQGKGKGKIWTGRIADGRLNVRLGFLLERALNAAEASALTVLTKADSGMPLDPAICRTVQPNYIARPRWSQHPERDPLGVLATIGWVRGAQELVPVPDTIETRARWAKAQGRGGGAGIADHPSAEAAVAAIGSDGAVRSHLMSAVVHLLRANPVPEVVSHLDHARVTIRTLDEMVERERAKIRDNLTRHGRGWDDVAQYLPDNMLDWALWCLDHQGVLRAKTIALAQEEWAAFGLEFGRIAIFARVERVIELARRGVAIDPLMQLNNEAAGRSAVVLCVAPPGARKSTRARAAAVKYLAENPGRTVVIATSYHKLNDEQLARLAAEFPGIRGAIWRGKHRDDPETPDPKRPGKFKPMCWRSPEAAELEEALIDVESHLCKRGRGKKQVRCPLFDQCGTQRQKRKTAQIWFAAHEVMVHTLPKAFGDVGWVIVDESPLDAFLFGTDAMTLELDTLRERVGVSSSTSEILLEEGRRALYQALDRLKVPIDPHRGVPATRADLRAFLDGEVELPADDEWPARRYIEVAEYDPRQLRALEWRAKVEPRITPTMRPRQVRAALKAAAGNARIRKLVVLWEAVAGGGAGRLQLQRGKEGRIIRLAGVRAPATGWNVPTLVLDATGEAELLRAIWPQLEEPEPHGWEQLPRPSGVRVFQVVDRALSKWAVAVEAKNEKELARKVKAARELYGSVLVKAAEYGGGDVGLIVSTVMYRIG